LIQRTATVRTGQALGFFYSLSSIFSTSNFMRKSIPAYLFLLGLGLSACSEQNIESPKQQTAKQQANDGMLGAGGEYEGPTRFDFPYAPEQYVSKSVQVETPADSSERPERPRFNTSDGEPELIDSEEPAAGYTSLNYTFRSSFEDSYAADQSRPASFSFEHSTGKGLSGYRPVSLTPSGYPDYIYDIQIAKSESSGIDAKSGYVKIPLDLNRGAGGKFIYLTFSRTRAEYSEFGQDTYPGYMRTPMQHGSYNYYFDNNLRPLTTITAHSYRTTTIPTSPPNGFTNVYQFIPQFTGPYAVKYWKVDLNDGAGGRYIRPYKSRTEGGTAYIKEVGVIAGNSSNIFPPSGWLRDPNDLNEGAGGDYIYLCYKR
jgi:hypothetical protein